MLFSSILSSHPAYPLQNPPKISAKFHSSLADSIDSVSCRPKRRCNFYDLHEELLPYAEAWSWQNAIVEEKKTLNQRNEDLADSLITLQHHPVYTLGAGSSLEFLNFDVEDAPFDLYRTERGGEITYHGPGQLVMYPIINLRYHKMDLHWYMRALEEVVIRALSSAFSIEASRIEGLTGVWVGNKKLAAIGIRVSQWIAYHGLALNVTTDTTPFQHIIPCGIRDRQVGTIKGLLQENAQRIWRQERDDLDDSALITCAYESLIREFSEVFQVELFMNPYKSHFGQAIACTITKRDVQIPDNRIAG